MQDIKPIPVEAFEDGYKPRHAYRTLDAYIWKDCGIQMRSRRWVLRVQLDSGRDTFSHHPTLKAARITASIKLGVRP
jgi:hypothetical protein